MSIITHNLRKEFRARRAVDDVSFEIARGVTGLIGPNGSGKTTILRMLATFLVPSAGTIRIAGHDAAADPAAVRRSIGYLPETLPAYPEARVEEFLDFRARLKGIPRRKRRAEIDRCLTHCRIAPVRKRLLGRLSQGYRRRAGLADALLGSPPVLLLDEPTVALDPLQVRQTRALLEELSQSATVLLSTHLLTEAQAVCDRALMLVRGRLASDVALPAMNQGNIYELTLTSVPGSCETALHAIPGVRTAERIGGDDSGAVYRIAIADTARPEEIVRACVNAGWGVRAFGQVHNDLESHFVRIALDARKEAA